MLPAQLEADLQQVSATLMDAEPDIDWLRDQLDRLTAAAEQLEPDDRTRTEWLLRRVRDEIAADEADQAWADAGTGEHPVVQAIRIRAAASIGTGDAEHIRRLRAAVPEILAVAETTSDVRMARAVRQEAWLVHEQAAALEAATGGTDVA